MSYDVDTTSDRIDPARGLDHVTVENENAPDECALFPQEATDEELATNWITATEGGFVDLASIR